MMGSSSEGEEEDGEGAAGTSGQGTNLCLQLCGCKRRRC